MACFFNSWRADNPHVFGGPMAVRPPLPSTKFFDNLSFIGNADVACFVIETTEGLVMLDCMNINDAPYVENGLIELGYDPATLKHILITHAHPDHYGNAVYFREKYGTELHMSAIDEAFARDPKTPRPSYARPMPFAMDSALEPGTYFSFGDARIKICFTPGHTPGCLSFIFDVYDEGRAHKAALWGGIGLRPDIESNRLLLKSLDEFAVETANEGVDVAISTHTFVDNMKQRLELLRNIVNGVPNPFIMGYDGYKRFELMYRKMYSDAVARG